MQIQPEQYYNFSEIARLGFFPFKDRRTYKSIILRNKEVFKPVISGNKEGAIFLVKGKYLLENKGYFMPVDK